MPSILRDPVWQFIGALFGFAAIVVAVATYRWQRHRKVLSYEILTNTLLLNVQQELKSRIQVLFDGQPVDSVRLMLVRITNSGNAPVVAADYESPIRLSLEKDARIFTADLAEANPANLTISPTVEGADVLVSRTLLNPGDSVTLRVLAQSDGTMTVGARIVGVSRIEDVAVRVRKRTQFFVWFFLLYTGCGSLGLGILTVMYGLSLRDTADSAVRVLLVGFGAIFVLIGVTLSIAWLREFVRSGTRALLPTARK